MPELRIVPRSHLRALAPKRNIEEIHHFRWFTPQHHHAIRHINGFIYVVCDEHEAHAELFSDGKTEVLQVEPRLRVH